MQIMTIFNSCIIMINVVYMLMALLVSYYLKNQIRKAKSLVMFLNVQDTKTKKEKDKKEQA